MAKTRVPPSTQPWAALTIPVRVVDPLADSWGLGRPVFAWERRSAGDCSVGFGAAQTIDARVGSLLQTLDRLAAPGQVRWLDEGLSVRPPGPWFGGIAFDALRTPRNGWAGFPPSRWILPKLLLWKRAGQGYLTAFEVATESDEKSRQLLAAQLSAAQERLSPSAFPAEVSYPKLEICSDREHWLRLMDRALATIASGSLQKVVIARAVDVETPLAFDPVRLVHALREDSPNCTTFLIGGGDGSAFVGATPELLCRWSDSVLETEALAGSASLSDAAALLKSDKENREHLAVIEGITEALRPLALEVRADKSPALFGLRHLFHLRTAISANLRPEVKVSEVVSALHPTPAVGGVPRDRAFRFLAEHEGLERGWYAGAIGWVGERGVELAVAIRSALIRDRRARLFVGAGVVAGSTPEGEWEETETKGLTMLAALGGPRASG